MPVYKYKAMDRKGQKKEGKYTAATEAHVVSMLRDNFLIPIKIEEQVQSKEIELFSFMQKVKTKDIAIFCRQFYTMINAGVSIINCLEILSKQTENKKLRKIIIDIYDNVQKGITLSEAMDKHKNIFPELLINMVQAGEASGNLDTIMERMAVHFEKENKINNKVKNAMIYPIILSVIATVVIIVMLTVVMPNFIGMFEGSGVELPAPTRILLAISDGIKKFWYIIVGIIGLVVFLFRRFIKTDEGRLSIDRLKFRLPIIKGSTKMIVTSRFTRTLSTLLSSGVSLIEALEIVSDVVENRVVSDGLNDAKEDVRKGIDLSTPIKNIGVFPPMVESMIKIGEESGSLDEILDRTADFYDEEVEAAMQKMTTALEPIMIVVMAIVMGAILIAMVMPMFEMVNTIQF